MCDERKKIGFWDTYMVVLNVDELADIVVHALWKASEVKPPKFHNFIMEDFVSKLIRRIGSDRILSGTVGEIVDTVDIILCQLPEVFERSSGLNLKKMMSYVAKGVIKHSAKDLSNNISTEFILSRCNGCEDKNSCIEYLSYQMFTIRSKIYNSYFNEGSTDIHDPVCDRK